MREAFDYHYCNHFGTANGHYLTVLAVTTGGLSIQLIEWSLVVALTCQHCAETITIESNFPNSNFQSNFTFIGCGHANDACPHGRL